MPGLRWSSSEEMLRELGGHGSSGSTRLGDDATVQIDGLDGASVVPIAIRVDERVNDLYRIDLVADVEHVRESSLRSTALGRAIHIELQRGGAAPRRFHGIIASASLLTFRDGHASYHFVVVPKLWLAQKSVDSRVFSDLTVQEIVTTVLNDSGVVHAWSLTGRYERREYVVQYEESDYVFLRRLLAEVGIFFSFYHPPDVASLRERLAMSSASTLGNEVVGVAQQGFSDESLRGAGERVLGQAGTILQIAEVSAVGELLVLADSAATYARLDDTAELVFDASIEGGAMSRDESHIPHFAVKSAVEPTRATVREYDHERAQFRPHGTVLATLPAGYRGALADGMSALTDAGTGLLNDGLGELEGAAGLAGPLAQATDIPLANPASALGQANENRSHGVITATHAVMAPEVAIARSAVAVAGALGEELLASTPLSGAAGAVAGGLQSAISGAEAVLEHYEHHGEYEEPEASFALARMRVEQLRTHHIECHGESHCRTLMAGLRFDLSGHDLAHLNRGYAVVHVVHEVFGDHDAGPVYQNEFACIPSNVPARPHPPHRHYHQNMETGVVVGVEGQEITTDHLGKVKVQFHWDRRKKHDEHSSCWIRVMQAWAGPQFGFQFIPRIGMEVLVSFIGGDMNRPVVVGCMPNIANQPPYHVPQDKTRSGIRTRSTPGGEGHNELMFDDKAGHEAVHLRAEKNFEELIRHNHIVRVGNDEHVTVGGNREEEIEHDAVSRVRANYTHEVTGDSSATVHGSASQSYDGDRTLAIGGVDHQQIDGNRFATIRGIERVIVRRPEGGGRALHDTMVEGAYRLSVGGDTRVSAQDAIELVVGGSSIRISSDGIVLRARNITLEAEERIVSHVAEDSAMHIESARIDLTSAEVTANGDGSALKLDADAHLDGGRVMLNCGGREPLSAEAEEEPGQNQVRFRVEPPEGTEGALTFVIATPDGEVIECEADANHEVTLDGRPGDHFTLLDVRAGDFSLGVHLPAQEED